MLVGGMCSICCHMALVLAIMHSYSIINFRLFLSVLLYIIYIYLYIYIYFFFNPVLKRRIDTIYGTSISLFY